MSNADISMDAFFAELGPQRMDCSSGVSVALEAKEIQFFLNANQNSDRSISYFGEFGSGSITHP
jgi:hypothetical protein